MATDEEVVRRKNAATRKAARGETPTDAEMALLRFGTRVRIRAGLTEMRRLEKRRGRRLKPIESAEVVARHLTDPRFNDGPE